MYRLMALPIVLLSANLLALNLPPNYKTGENVNYSERSISLITPESTGFRFAHQSMADDSVKAPNFWITSCYETFEKGIKIPVCLIQAMDYKLEKTTLSVLVSKDSSFPVFEGKMTQKNLKEINFKIDNDKITTFSDWRTIYVMQNTIVNRMLTGNKMDFSYKYELNSKYDSRTIDLTDFKENYEFAKQVVDAN